MTDPAAYRHESRARWEAAAAGWEARRADLQRAAEPVSRWLVEAIAPRPGHTVLELAAGVGDTGLLAAELIRPGGRLICTDGAEAMVEAARRRAQELGADNVEHRVMEAEWIDLPTAAVDGVLCRWGYMLLADPETALRETRRVLRPGGRVALAAWDGPEHNPWIAATGAELRAQGLAAAPGPDAPGMFAFAAPGRIEDLLGAAGFSGVEVGHVDVTFSAPSFAGWFAFQRETSPSLSEALAADPERQPALAGALERRLGPWTAPDGALTLPGRTLVAAAEA